MVSRRYLLLLRGFLRGYSAGGGGNAHNKIDSEATTIPITKKNHGIIPPPPHWSRGFADSRGSGAFEEVITDHNLMRSVGPGDKPRLHVALSLGLDQP